MADIRLTLLLIINITVYIIQAERNVAVGKSTNQSSTAHGGESSRSLDGDTNSCTLTETGSPSWWCVDLAEKINIESMDIYNRDSNKGRLQGFEIRLSSTDSCDAAGLQSAELCYKDTTTTPQDIYTIEQCNQASFTSFNGTFVFISVEGPADKTLLTLCEVKIFEECSIQCKDGKCNQEGKCNTCKPGRVGDYCDNTCGDGCLSYGSPSSCDRNGKCFHGCINGRSGLKCDKYCEKHCIKCQRNYANSCLKCTDGRFGASCDELCNTNCKFLNEASGAVCDITNGLCTLGCRDGFYGDDCQDMCSTGCQDNICGQTNGSCSNGCVAGKTKDNCITDCPDGWYGVNCTSKCGQCADDIKCDKSTGRCGLVGCQNGFIGPQCQTDVTDSPVISPLVAGIIGALSSGGIFIGAVIFTQIYRRRKSTTEDTNYT